MPVVGSVNATVTTATTSITMPEANLTIVGLIQNGAHILVPIDSGRNAVFPNGTGLSGVTMRRTSFTLKGTALNVTIPTSSTTTVIVYYGTPLSGSQPLLAFAGIATSFTLVAGTATVTATFPSGSLRLTGVAGRDSTAQNNVFASWAVASGKLFTAFFAGNTLFVSPNNEDIIPLDMPVAQTLSVTVTGTGTDTGFVYHFYK